MILVGPLWPHVVWFLCIPLAGQPWELPLHRDLLSQARGTLFHPFPAGLKLMALPLSRTGSWP